MLSPALGQGLLWVVRNRHSSTPALLHSLGRNCEGHLVQPSMLCGTRLSSSPSKRCSSCTPPGQKEPVPQDRPPGGIRHEHIFPQLDQLCFQWLLNHRFKLNPQLPVFFNPTALQILLLFHTVQSLINSFLTNVSLQQMRIL